MSSRGMAQEREGTEEDRRTQFRLSFGDHETGTGRTDPRREGCEESMNVSKEFRQHRTVPRH